MEIGRTDFDTPAVVKEAAKRALDGVIHYPLPWACWSYGRRSPKSFGKKAGSR
jgi:hypothetical protein